MPEGIGSGKAKRTSKATASSKSKVSPKKSTSPSRARAALAKMRKIIARWPETDERLSHGAPTFWGGKKTFASFTDNHHGDGRIAIWCKSTFDAQSDLVEADPDVFFVPPYVGPSGWVGIEVSGNVDWDLVASVLEQGYRMVAPQRALKQLDG